MGMEDALDADDVEAAAHFGAILDGYRRRFRRFGNSRWRRWDPSVGWFQRPDGPDGEVRKLMARGVPAEVAYEAVEQRIRHVYWLSAWENDRPMMGSAPWTGGVGPPESPPPLSPLSDFLDDR